MGLESFGGDIRFALRIFKRSPAVALTVIGTLAVALGREMAGALPETYVSMPQLLTRINGRPAMGELVTGNYFSLLGVPAFRGRLLRPSDSEAPGREPVVVLSHDGWMRLFGGDPAAVG